MNTKLFALAFSALIGVTAQADTLAKAKDSGVITMGVRDSSGALSYTLGDGKYAGYHIEICQRILANLEKSVGRKLEVKYQSVTSQTARWISNAVLPPTTRHAKRMWLLW